MPKARRPSSRATPAASEIITTRPPRAMTSSTLRQGLFEEVVGRRQHDDRHVVVDQRDRPVLHLAGGIALGVDVGDLLQLQRAFERQRIGAAAAEIEHVAGERDLGGDLLDALVVVQDLAGARRDLGELTGEPARPRAAARSRRAPAPAPR